MLRRSSKYWKKGYNSSQEWTKYVYNLKLHNFKERVRKLITHIMWNDIKFQGVSFERNARKIRFYVRYKLDECQLCSMSIFRFSKTPKISPRVSIKPMELSIFLLRNRNIRLVLSLDEILLIADSLNDIELAIDILIFLLKNLGFLII